MELAEMKLITQCLHLLTTALSDYSTMLWLALRTGFLHPALFNLLYFALLYLTSVSPIVACCLNLCVLQTSSTARVQRGHRQASA